MKFLDFVMLLLDCGVEIYFTYDFFSAYYEKKSNMQGSRLWLVSIAAAFLLFLSNMLGNGHFNTIFFLVIIWIYVASVFSGNLGKRCITYLIVLFIIWGCEWLCVIIMNPKSTQYMTLSEVPLTIVALKLLTYIVLIVVKQITGKSSKKMDNNIFLRFILLPLSSFGVMLCIFYSTVSFTTTMKLIMVLCFSFMLIGNILMYYSFVRYSEQMHENMQQQVTIVRQDADLNYYKQRIKLNEEYDEFVHDTSHYLKTIRQFAAAGNCQDILNILGELDEKMEQNELIRYSTNHVLNSVVSDKKAVAEAEQIDFDVYVEPGVKLDMITDIDLIVLLANLLDNALRAAKECQAERYVKLQVFMQNNDKLTVIKVINGYEGPIHREKDVFISTKKEKGLHGLGLKSVARKAESYGGHLQCSAEDGEFEAIVILSADQQYIQL